MRVLLCIHTDTVYAVDHPFQTTTLLDADTLRGPGVADAKGGIAVMLTALQAFEQTPWASRLGWEVLLNPDEEIGSPGSTPLLADAAKRNHVGLLFEPAMPDGSMAGRRKGSGNFTLVVRGRSAHAGRDFALGRNAIVAMAELVGQLHGLNGAWPGVTVNVGRIEGGGAVNVVPDLAIARVNVRTTKAEDEPLIRARFEELVAQLNTRDGITAELHGHFSSPAKIPDARTLSLLKSIAECGRELGLDLTWRDSGGVCDGNKLAAFGLPNVDTLGVRGGEIHSPAEFLKLDSLTERAKLVMLVMGQLAAEHAAAWSL
jgi:glutamate carboxypeptidase